MNHTTQKRVLTHTGISSTPRTVFKVHWEWTTNSGKQSRKTFL
ncbi:MAG: hypothetical protein VX588_10770 [Verrucomicrobiota bacterium]|nr:hypothetical protein [Verrucomicrobiota bacterium]